MEYRWWHYGLPKVVFFLLLPSSGVQSGNYGDSRFEETTILKPSKGVAVINGRPRGSVGAAAVAVCGAFLP